MDNDLAPGVQDVAIVHQAATYPSEPPFHPGERYPEIVREFSAVSLAPNAAYAGVREVFRALGCDAQRFGTEAWNPMSVWISPGDHVVVKPNWVMDSHPAEARLGERAGFECLVTHPSVLRAVIDYVQLALRGRGRITIADAPLQGCNFERLRERSRLSALESHFFGLASRPAPGSPFASLPISIVDMRLETAIPQPGLLGIGTTYEKTRRAALDRHTIVQLGGHSSLEALAADAERFRVTCYDASELRATHRPGFHTYCIGNEILDADVVVNVPKLKSHKKSGITVALKGLVGINGHKSYLPHHRLGSVDERGDEYLTRDLLKLGSSRLQDYAYRGDTGPRRRRAAVLTSAGLAALGRLVREDSTETGSWYGNDTIWRTCIDLNRILLFTDKRGAFMGADPDARPQRRVVHIVDGIHGGDGDGPLAPNPRPAGIVMAGSSAAYVDLAASMLMGFAWWRIPLVRGAFAPVTGAPLVTTRPEHLRLHSTRACWDGVPFERAARAFPEHLAFQAPPGWETVIEQATADDLPPVDRATRRQGLLWRLLPSAPRQP